MPAQNTKIRTIGKSAGPKRPRITDNKITAIARAVVVAIQENTGIYVSGTSTTGGIKLKFYTPDETLQAYVNWGEDVEQEVHDILTEVFEQDTWDDAAEVLRAGLAEQAQEGPESPEPTPDSRKRVSKA